MYSEALPDGERRGLDAVGSFWCKDVCAEQPTVAGVGNELDEPRVSRAASARGTWSRLIVETRTTCPAARAAASVNPTLATCGSANTMGQGAVVVAQGIAIEGVLRGELRTIGGHVHELVAAGDIAGGIDANLGRSRPVVDDDRTFRQNRDAVLGEPKAFDVGCAPGGDQHLIGVDRTPSRVTVSTSAVVPQWTKLCRAFRSAVS